MSETLSTSPLHARHTELGAKFAEFGGFEMPLQYSGVVDEHTAVRERVGLFDVSHLGKATVTGEGATAFLDRCFTNTLAKIGEGMAQYTLCCNSDGGVLDDMIVYVRAADDVLLVPNAANNAEVVRRLTESAAAAPEPVEVRNVHTDWAVLAVQGPSSAATLEALGLPTEHPYMSMQDASLPGVPEVVVCRSGYTGERGYELLVRSEHAEQVWDAVMSAGEPYGIVPCGLGARDTLRTDMGYPLHGQDLSPDITPVEGRSSWAVGWNKPEFWGREALLAQRAAGPSRRLRGIRAVGRGIPRPGMTVRAQDAEGGDDGRVGQVTSGTFSPTLRQGIGLALLDVAVGEGDQVVVDVRGRSETFDVVRPPFVQAGDSS
ncbi:MAG TPA: glycine cleavage system aminomethyltransferase GcvT [Jiangellaceae bacterium]|nr:glycine cleavage system aminomethyltransferase GcvT [Jiangellaceae bacterium]